MSLPGPSNRRGPHATFLLWAILLLCCTPFTVFASGWKTIWENDRAWLLTPSGARFYSLGINSFNSGTPHPKGLGYYWKAFSPSPRQWAHVARKRFEAWGFNTLGAWSDPVPGSDLPLTPVIYLGRNAMLHWVDPFSPASRDQTLAVAKQATAPFRGPRNLVGYFTDNEVGWWNAPLFSWYLAAEWSNHTKQTLWWLLHDHYNGRWEKLVVDFVPEPEVLQFEDLKKGGTKLKLRPGGNGIEVVAAFTRLCAGRYYQLVHSALRDAHPEALVLGDRLPLYYNQDAVLAARGFVDVLSTNYNVDEADGWVAPYYFEGLHKLIEAPVLVTEFFFAASENRSGNTNNGHLMHVRTQEQRARGAAAAQAAFAAFPNVVGSHWFQYYDEPTGGRIEDGEDFNMGLVDILDRPYAELVEALTTENARVEGIHARSRFDTPPPANAPVRMQRLPHPSDCTDDSLLDWPDKRGTRLLGFTTPDPYVPFGDVHVAWTPEGLSFFHLAGCYADLSLLDFKDQFPLSESYQLHVYIDAGRGMRHFAVHLLVRAHPEYEKRFELEPRLYQVAEDGRYAPLPTEGFLQALDKPIPHVAVELFLPSTLLGIETLTAGDTIAARISVTSFYRELTMTFDAGPAPSSTAGAQPRKPRLFVLSE